MAKQAQICGRGGVHPSLPSFSQLSYRAMLLLWYHSSYISLRLVRRLE